jgi:isopentenyl diphosphate isomerase/L-lactate dehydrogenase-like FMN-dependent dehydrogenase
MSAFRFALSGRKQPVSVEEYRQVARRAIPGMVWAYIENGAETESALHSNQAVFSRYRFRPRALSGRLPRDVKVTVAGRELNLPVLLAPTGLTGLTHWTGEIAAARAAERSGTLAILSTASTYTLEEVAKASTSSHFFQLYPCSNASGSENPTRDLMARAERAGYDALFVTIDVPVVGNRDRERSRGMGNPPVLTPARLADAARHPRWCYHFFKDQRVSARNLVAAGGARAAVASVTAQTRLLNPYLSWEDIAWMRDAWPRRLFVKGILSPEDAAAAIGVGADGVVVSNHGGRQLDHAPATLDVLPAVVEAVGGRGEVILDGGIRRGSDVVKALCLGASVVCIGRPYLYGLAAGGQSGVEAILDILRDEITRTLTLLGATSLDELGPQWLSRSDTQTT